MSCICVEDRGQLWMPFFNSQPGHHKVGQTILSGSGVTTTCHHDWIFAVVWFFNMGSGNWMYVLQLSQYLPNISPWFDVKPIFGHLFLPHTFYWWSSHSSSDTCKIDFVFTVGGVLQDYSNSKCELCLHNILRIAHFQAMVSVKIEDLETK